MSGLIKSACPFCGSNDIRFMGYPGMYTNSHCECKDCNTIGPAVFVDDEKAATEAWNRRTQLAPVAIKTWQERANLPDETLPFGLIEENMAEEIADLRSILIKKSEEV